MSVAIRQLGFADGAALGELMTEIAGKHSDDGATAATAFLASLSTFVFGAYLDDQPVGWAWGHAQRMPDGRVAGYLHEIDVVERARRRGLASMLMEAVLAQARRERHHHLWLTTEADNAAANALYESLGGSRSDRGDIVYAWRFDR